MENNNYQKKRTIKQIIGLKTNHILQDHQEKIHFFNDVANALENGFNQSNLQFFIKFVLPFDPHNTNKISKKIYKDSNKDHQQKINQNPLNINPFIFINKSQSSKNIKKIKTEPITFQKSVKRRNLNTPIHNSPKIYFDNKNHLDLDRKIQRKWQNKQSNRFFSIDPLLYPIYKPTKPKAYFRAKFIKNRKDRYQTQIQDSENMYIPKNLLTELKKSNWLNDFSVYSFPNGSSFR